MKLSDFDYELPSELIASSPEQQRDHSRLLHIDKKQCSFSDKHFFDITSLLQKGDVIVFNNSKVFPARLFGSKTATGGKIELLLLSIHDAEENIWVGMVKTKNAQPNLQCTVHDANGIETNTTATLIEKNKNTWLIQFGCDYDDMSALLQEYGHTPLPPYIKENDMNEETLRDVYQTVYAKEEGSAAAPTAGLHFTEDLIDQLIEKGIQIEEVTLHVGLGTFAPVQVDDISDHHMHSELASITKDTADRINAAKQEGRRIIAVGTTSTRTLETFMKDGELQHGSEWTDIFITPGYDYQCIDGLITNFHLPKSTLLMLVSALMGQECMKKAYAHAIEEQYRFYSFGDAMIIL